MLGDHAVVKRSMNRTSCAAEGVDRMATVVQSNIVIEATPIGSTGHAAGFVLHVAIIHAVDISESRAPFTAIGGHDLGCFVIHAS